MAAGILERKGFKMPRNLKGGSQAWINEGLPVYEASKESGTRAAGPRKQVRLPDRISASELKRLIMDLPGTFELIDLRPAEQFADYSLPGSKNLHVADVLSDPAYLVGAGPLILVDRDGSIAMAAGGILSQKTERPIKVLYGGLEAYWNESPGAFFGRGAFQKQAPPPTVSPKSAVRPMPPPAKKPPEPKARDAGC